MHLKVNSILYLAIGKLAVLVIVLTGTSSSCKKESNNTSPGYLYTIVGTGVKDSYSDAAKIPSPSEGDAFYGQDASYQYGIPSYSDNGDGTVTDNITGLTWQKDMGGKVTFAEALSGASSTTLGGHSDWRMPSIKELYSLILFTGTTGKSESNSIPYIDTDYFSQPFGDESVGERFIDAQTWSATEYVGRTMNGDETIFGVNFIDGRIKGYPKYKPGTSEGYKLYARYVRGNSEYGKNSFVDNGDGTISDLATGLMWQKADNGNTYNWEDALEYATSLVLAGYEEWRLPSAKELHSIVDYTKSPQTTSSAAISSLFFTTEITDPDGNAGQYPYFWTGTTHLDPVGNYSYAVYFAFGEAQGKMNDKLMDVHGAGAQRSDPKSGEKDDYPQFFGPQGDVRYVFNYVRCVRNIN